jgi:diaminohydroxyphosphoribosylaminopyrimidine deaminase / 5-amino-6-(5-phosphoribosylamino)uracil reductase
MLTKENGLFLRRCFDLGRLGRDTSPNPSVGSVIVAADGRIIGEGFTHPYGGAHAEVNAVASVAVADRSLLPFSTIYVSLEPCFHVGKTGACVELILREKISKVVIAHLDPNPLVGGKSVTKLRENGVEVQVFSANNLLNYQNTVTPMRDEAKDVKGGRFWDETQLENGKIVSLMPFFTNMTKKRPYIVLKWAESADGFIGQLDKQVKITNNYSKKIVHKWRSESDAIMVGTTTAAVDNPALTNRMYFGKSPIRVVLDRNARLSPDLNVFDGAARTIIFSEFTEGVQSEINKLKHPTFNVDRQLLAFDDFLLDNILMYLLKEKIGILFVEGGEKLLSSLIQRGLWDEARVFTASKTLGEGIRAPQLLNAELQSTHQLADDRLHIYKHS